MNKTTRSRVSASGVIAVALFGAILHVPVSSAQPRTYPVRAIRIVVPYVPGGAVDAFVRPLAQKLHEAWGQPVIGDNRPGAGSNLGTEVVVRAPADGYTLLGTSSVIAVNAVLYRKLPFDVVADLAPVGLVVQQPNVLAVHPSLPARSVTELIKLARAKPGEIAYASSGTGSPTHLGMELIRYRARIDLLHIPFKGGAQSLPALIGGQTQAAFITLHAVLPMGRTGRVRMLAVSGASRVESAPDLPTIAEAGLPGFEMTPWYGIFAPARTPREVVLQLNAEINRVVQLPEVRERFLAQGMVPLGGTPERHTEVLKAEIMRAAEIIKAAGIALE